MCLGNHRLMNRTFSELEDRCYKELCRKVLSDKELDAEKQYNEYNSEREIGNRYSFKAAQWIIFNSSPFRLLTIQVEEIYIRRVLSRVSDLLVKLSVNDLSKCKEPLFALTLKISTKEILDPTSETGTESHQKSPQEEDLLPDVRS